MILSREAEAYVVHRVRTAVNLQHHRILPGRIEVGRFHDPALNPIAVDRRVPDFFSRRQLLAGEHIAIHIRELSDHRRPHIESHDVVGLRGRARNTDRHERTVHVAHGEHLCALRHLPDVTRERYKVQIARPFVLHVEVHATRIGRPHHAGRRAIELLGQSAGVAAVGIHDIHRGVFPRGVGAVVAGVRNEASIGRGHR